jgi:hypothetical protein
MTDQLQALHVVDSPHFRDMIMAANPSITDKDIPHRTSVTKQILKRYKQERIGLREKLKVCYLYPLAAVLMICIRMPLDVSH